MKIIRIHIILKLLIAFIIGFGFNAAISRFLFQPVKKVETIPQVGAQSDPVGKTIADTVELASILRQQPGASEQERIFLENYLEKVESVWGSEDPSHPARAEIARLYAVLVSLKLANGKGPAFITFRNRAKSALYEVMDHQPDRIEIIRDLAMILNMEADELALFHPLEALEKCNFAIEIIGKALVLRPKSGSLRDRLIWIYKSQAAILSELGMKDEAKSTLKIGLSYCDSLLKEFPTGHPLSYIRPALLYSELAKLDAIENKHELAEIHFKQGLDYCKTLREQFPGQIRLQESVGMIPLDFVEYLLNSGNVQLAQEILEEVTPLVNEFYEKFPTLNLAFQQKEKHDDLSSDLSTFLERK